MDSKRERVVTAIAAAGMIGAGFLIGGPVLGAVAQVVGGAAVFFLTRTPPEPKPNLPAAADTAKAQVKELRGALVVETTPPGAAIWIAGELRKEQTPATIENLPLESEIEVKLTMDGFESYKDKLTLECVPAGS